MTRKLVAVVDAKTSKADEVAALHKMAECATRGSYLASLFTPELLEWVEGQIEMDLPPDIMETRSFQDARTGTIMEELSRVRRELADADRKAGWAAQKVEDRHQRELAQTMAKLTHQNGTVAFWRGEAQAARAQAEAYRDSVLWAWGWVGWLMTKRDEAERLVEQTKVNASAMLEKALLGKPQEESE